jgi:glycosyltransferase involved in cell wall biosynthesis
MKKPLITVYIASHNYGKFLEAAIESVLRQTVDNWELLIFNDNSTDNTDEVMKFYAADPRIRLFKTNGVGLPAVCNLALKESKGEMLIRLDGDDMFDENILLVLSNFLERHTDCAMVFPDYYLIDEFGCVLAHERRESLNDKNHLSDIPAHGACSLIRKKVLKKLGGYREDLGAQDGFDIWNKIKEKYRIANVNLPLFYYRRHEENLSNNEEHIFRARYQIKLDTIKDRIDAFRPVIALIPCRMRYDFTSNLWNCKINGKSLLERCISKCIDSTLFDYIVVAADTKKVCATLKKFEDNRLHFFKRLTKDTVRSASLAPTLQEIIKKFDPDCRGISVISYLQAPLVKTQTLEEAIGTLILNNVSSSMGMEEIEGRLFRRSHHGMQPINHFPTLTTDFETIYREANTALALLNKNLNNGSMLGPQTIHFEVSNKEYFFINSEQNLKITEILLEKTENGRLWRHHSRPNRIPPAAGKGAFAA